MRRDRLSALLLLATALSVAGCAAPAQPTPAGTDHAAHTGGGSADRTQMWQASLARVPLAVTAAFDHAGRLWRARVRDGQVWLDMSHDRGRNFSDAVPVNNQPEHIAADGENRPKLAFGPAGEIYVSWTQSLDVPFSGHVRFARSLDGGRRFDAPLTVNDNLDAIGHRFDALLVTPQGDIHIVWLDKRDAQAATRDGRPYAGLSVYTAVSTDRGASFHANRKLADHSCECCRISMAADAGGVPVIVWRQVYGQNTRDHALLRLDGTSPPVRVSVDNWAVDACPHHGPGLAIAADNTHHIVWFTNAPARHGLFYARSTDGGRTFSAPLGFGRYDAQAGHAHVLSLGKSVFIAWKEFDGESGSLQLMRSDDAGEHWSAPQPVATTQGASDHPLLIADARNVYVSWNTLKDGYRLVAVGAVGEGK